MKQLLTITFFVTCCLASWGQLNQVRVSSLNVKDQLPVAEITQIFQDSDGWMWYGTSDGLCRDDGYHLHVFRHDYRSPMTPNINMVYSIAEDGENHLWIGTGEGLFMMDRTTFNIELIDNEELKTSEIKYMISSADGTIWAMGRDNLFHIDTKGNVLKQYEMIGGIVSIFENCHHQLFVSKAAGGLLLKESGKEDFETLHETLSISTMLEDTLHHCYWLCDRDKSIFKMTHNTAAHSIELEAQDVVYDDFGKVISYFTHIVQDNQYHYIWAISYYRGLYVFRVENGRLKQLDTSGIFSRNNNILSNMIITSNGSIWVSGFDRSSFIISLENSGMKFEPLEGLSEITNFIPAITALCKDSGGMFWIQQKRNDLRLYDPETGKYSNYKDSPETSPLPLYLVTNIVQSHADNAVWIATYGPRAVLLGREGMKMKVLNDILLTDYSSNISDISCIHEDKQMNLWIGTRNALYVWRKKTGNLEILSETIGDVTCFAESEKGDIWCTIKKKGVMKIDEKGKLTLYPLEFDMMTLDITSNGILWIGTSQGRIFSFDENEPEGERYADYTYDCGATGDMIDNINVDIYDHVWITTNQRIYEFNPSNGAYRIFATSSSNILMNRFLPGASFKDNTDGKIYYGGIPGFVAVTPSHMLESVPQDVKPHISNISIMGNSLWFTEGHKDKDGTIIIQPDERNVAIEFTTLDYDNVSSIRFAYMMEGFDDEWIELPAGVARALYNQLPKGKYTFKVKATDKNGLWSESVTTISIRRLPAWYETTIAYIVYALLLLAVIFFLFYLYKRYVQLESQKKITEDITQNKLTYFTSISHELLTPLTIISCLSEQIEAENEDDRNKIGLIKANVMRLKRLLQQVLDFRKVESHNMKLSVQAGDITDFLQILCKESFEPLAKDKNIQFLTLLPVTNIEGFFDHDKLEKILFNLVTNAFKYTPEGKCVTLSALVQPNGILRLSVKDEGIGIDAKEQKLIFTRFYTSKNNTNSLSNGIGLSLTKELVELHHGQIWVESQVRQGAEFFVELPITRATYSEEEMKEEGWAAEEKAMFDKQPTDNSSEDNPSDSNKENLLMVEDNLQLLSVMQGLLAKNYNVFAATNGIEALDIVEKEEINVIVSDISMPRMDGFELCRRIKGDIKTSHITVILLTAKVSAEAQVETYNAGAEAYLAKPFESKVLLGLLANLKAQREKQQMMLRQDSKAILSNELQINDLDQAFMQKAIRIVEQYLDSPDLDVPLLASKMNLSRSTFARKIKAITGQAPFDFIKEIRLRHAYEMLLNSSSSVTEVMNRVGYIDHRSFKDSFRELFGVLPSEVKDMKEEN